MRFRFAFTLISAGVAVCLSADMANACTFALQPYDGKNVAVSIKGIVTSARGEGPSAVYLVRRTSIVKRSGAQRIPKLIKIDMTKLWMGTCGFDSRLLQTGDKILLFFTLSQGRLTPRGWKIT